MAVLKLKLLGGFELEGADRQRLPTRKAEALLAYLVMPAGRTHSREKLASLLWGDAGVANARHCLAQTLHLIRKTLGANSTNPLRADSRTIAADGSSVDVDVATFEKFAAQKTKDALAQAASLYKGDFLGGIHVREVAFESWLLGEQRRLHNMAENALETLLQQQFDKDEDDAAAETALQLLSLDPSNESVHRTLMRIYCRADRREAAIRQYLSCAEHLRRELGIEPDKETTRLYQEVSNNYRPYRHRAGSIADHREKDSIVHLPPDMPSIAVLPFANLSHEPDQEYFSDGIVDDLITALSKFRSFFVIARNSSFAYKGTELAISQVARELGVRYVIEGSVRKIDDRVRITSQLIDAETNHHLWAERYDRDFKDIFDLQDEMTTTIVGAFEPRLSESERMRAKRKHPESLSAWDCYQRGLWYHLKRTREDEEEAGSLFQSAIELDPQFSLAHAGLAEHFRRKVFYGWTDKPEQVRLNALQSAQEAVSTDDGDAYAHCTLGRVYTMQGNFEAAFSELEESLELNPNLALASFSLGFALTWFGRARDALPLLHKAIRQSPRDPQRSSMEMMIGYSYYMLKEYDQSVEWLERSSRHSASGSWSQLGLAAAFVALERMDDARTAINEALRFRPDLSLRSVATMLRPQYSENNERYLNSLRMAGLPEYSR